MLPYTVRGVHRFGGFTYAELSIFRAGTGAYFGLFFVEVYFDVNLCRLNCGYFGLL
jgi:hypothetical protein